MYRSGRVPRAIPLMGLIGAPLLITSTIAVLFGIIEPISAWSAIATFPVALRELPLGARLQPRHRLTIRGDGQAQTHGLAVSTGGTVGAGGKPYRRHAKPLPVGALLEARAVRRYE
jgi:hypothetical protein